MGTICLRASLLGRILVVGSPAVLIGLGAYGTLRGGVATPGAVLLFSGVVLVLLAGWVSPWVSEIGPEGILWKALISSRHINWDDVVAFERHARRRRDGPLVVRTVTGRRVALTDQVERPDEWDKLKEMVARFAPGAAFPGPPATHPFNRDS